MTDFEFERELQDACVAAAKACGCWPIENVVVLKGKRVTGLGAGSPDLLVIVPAAEPNGRPAYVWFELKRDGKSKRSPAQVRWHAQAALLKMRVYTVRSVTEMLAVIQAVRFGRAA